MFNLLGRLGATAAKKGRGVLKGIARSAAKKSSRAKNKADFNTEKSGILGKLTAVAGGAAGGGILGSLFGGSGDGGSAATGVTEDTAAAIKAVEDKKRIEELEKRVKTLEAQIGGFDTSRNLDVLEAKRESKSGALGSSIKTPAAARRSGGGGRSSLLKDLIAGAVALAVLNREAIADALGFADEEERETGVTDPSINRPFTQRLRLGLGDKFEAASDFLKRTGRSVLDAGKGLAIPSPTVDTTAPKVPTAPVPDAAPKVTGTLVPDAAPKVPATPPRLNLPRVVSNLDLPLQRIVTAPDITWDLGKAGTVKWNSALGRFRAPDGKIVPAKAIVDAIRTGRATPSKPVAGLADEVTKALDRALQPATPKLVTPGGFGAPKADPAPTLLGSAPDGRIIAAKPGTLSPDTAGLLPNVDIDSPPKPLVPDLSEAEKKSLRKSITKGAKVVALKAIPAIGAAAGTYFTVEKLVVGDYVGAAGEGISLFLPSVSGTAVDVTGAIRDVYNGQYGTPDLKYPFDVDPYKNPIIFGKRLIFIKREFESAIKTAIKNDRMGVVTTGRNFGADMGIGGKDYGTTGVGIHESYVPISAPPYRTLTDAGISQDVKEKPQVIVVPAPAADTTATTASIGSMGHREIRAEQGLNSTHSTTYIT